VREGGVRVSRPREPSLTAEMGSSHQPQRKTLAWSLPASTVGSRILNTERVDTSAAAEGGEPVQLLPGVS
jgi:hypothetical protein